MSEFLPTGEKAPEGNYMSFKEGENTFRVLSSAITGHEYWNKDNKPVRSKSGWTNIPADIRVDDEGKPTKIKYFWAFVVYSHRAEKAQILEVTQKGVQDAIRALVNNAKWGDPKKYDITVSRSGSGFDTEYTVMPNPHSDFPTELIVPTVNLEALFTGADPFQV